MRRSIRRKSRAFPANFVDALRSWAQELTGEPLVLAQESALLLLLSTFDILMTYVLLRQGIQSAGPGVTISFYESNPVARWWFVRWNMAGMTVFKFLMMAVAIAACEIVERRRPGMGRLVMSAGIIAVGAVVAYSALLFYRNHAGMLLPEG